MTPRRRLLVLGAALLLWNMGTVAIYVALARSGDFRWGNHPPLLFNSFALLVATFLVCMYRWKPSIGFGVHMLVSLALYGGAYLMITTGAVGVLHHDYSLLGQRYEIMTSILVPGACIDLWYRIRHPVQLSSH